MSRMQPRQSAGKKSAAPKLKFTVTLRRRRGAPACPSAASLNALFQRAWELAPAARRPDPLGQTRIAADVLLTGDDEIAALNQTHLHHSGPTDVISFPMGEIDPERQAYNLGEIVASFTTAKREARERKLPAGEELSRYCVHGFLHLLGYEDRSATQRAALFKVQEQALNAGKTHF